jgi:sortase A
VTRRRVGAGLAVAGALLVAYAAVVVLWRDPATDLYARWQQQRLDDALEKEFVEYRATEARTIAWAPGADSLAEPRQEVADSSRAVAVAARRAQARLQLGQPLGRIRIPKLGVDAVFVHGTRWA